MRNERNRESGSRGNTTEQSKTTKTHSRSARSKISLSKKKKKKVSILTKQSANIIEQFVVLDHKVMSRLPFTKREKSYTAELDQVTQGRPPVRVLTGQPFPDREKLEPRKL